MWHPCQPKRLENPSEVVKWMFSLVRGSVLYGFEFFFARLEIDFAEFMVEKIGFLLNTAVLKLS